MVSTGTAGGVWVDPDALAAVMHRALTARDLSEEHAGFVVDGLVEASKRGVDTHGVRLFRTYLNELDGGRAKAHPQFQWHEAGTAARVLDAGAALGMVAGRSAAAEAVNLAKQHGVGVVVVRNSNHFGPASCYTLEMARHRVLGLACTNSDALVAPFGGCSPLVGTNPISMTVEADEDDLFCADFATSQVSYSKVKHYRAHGRDLEAGWAVNAEGVDVARSEDRDVAALQPLGGYKGECLGLMVEILCPLLAGEPYDHELSHLYGEPYDEPRRVAHFFLGLHLPLFTDEQVFRARLRQMLQRVRAESGERGDVMVPGDPETRYAAQRREKGIPLTDEEASWFRGLPGGESL